MSLCLYMVWRSVLTSAVYMWLTRFPKTTFWRDSLSSIVYSSLLCWRLIDHLCGVLFLSSLFCSSDLCLLLQQYHTLVVTVVCSIAWNQKRLWLQLCSFSSGLLWQFWVFCGSIYILELFVPILWKMSWVIW